MKTLILGARGMLGSELGRQLSALGSSEQFFLYDFEELDVTDSNAVQRIFDEIAPDTVFNCAAYNNVDKAESEPDRAMLLNAEAVKNIAEDCQRTGATLVHYSTGFVFDGQNEKGYNESTLPNPQSVYAQSKFKGEQEAAKCDKHYIIRLNLLFGDAGASPNAKKSFPDLILDLAKEKKEFDFVVDEVSTPTFAPDLARASLELVRSQAPYGIYHLSNEGRASWYDFAAEIFRIMGQDIKLNGISAAQYPRPAKRPRYSVLLNTKLPKQRTWQAALQEYLSTKS